MTVTADPEITDNTVAVFEAMVGCLDGLSEAEAINAAVNVLARVLMAQAPTQAIALEWARKTRRDIQHCIRLNWPNVEDERAKNGGRQPRIGDPKQ